MNRRRIRILLMAAGLLAHQGVPGEHNAIAVAGTAAPSMCPDGIVND